MAKKPMARNYGKSASTSKSVKVIAIITAVVVLLGIAATVAVMVATYDPDAPRPGLYLNGKRVRNTGVMLTVGGHEIYYPEYRYYYLSTKYRLGMGDVSYWDSDPDGSKARNLKAETEKAIQEMYAWQAFASERGIGLTQEERDSILDAVKEEKRLYGTEYKNSLLNRFMMNEETYIKVTEMQQVRSKIEAEYYDEVFAQHRDELLDKNVVSVMHILRQFGEYATEEEALEASEKIVEEIHGEIEQRMSAATAQAGGEELSAEQQLEITKEVFLEMRGKYDGDSAGQPEAGYTFGAGTMVEEFYQGSLALEVGGISEPIRTDYGYHIILRLPLNMDSMVGVDDHDHGDEDYDEAEHLIFGDVQNLMHELFSERVAEQTVVPGEHYDSVSLASIK